MNKVYSFLQKNCDVLWINDSAMGNTTMIGLVLLIPDVYLATDVRWVYGHPAGLSGEGHTIHEIIH